MKHGNVRMLGKKNNGQNYDLNYKLCTRKFNLSPLFHLLYTLHVSAL